MKYTISSAIANGLWAIAPSFLPIPFGTEARENSEKRLGTYIDGLRGLASLCIYVENFGLPLFPNMRYGYGQAGDRAPLQLPIIRIFYAGHAWISILLILSGYTLSLKAMKVSIKDSYEGGCISLSQAVLRRVIRIYLPPLLSTFAFMIAVQTGVLNLSALAEFEVMRPVLQHSFLSQYTDWIDFVWHYLFNLWTWTPHDPVSSYGSHLWVIPVIVKGSFLVSIASIAICNMRFAPNLVFNLILVTYCIVWEKDAPALFSFGMLLATCIPTRVRQSTISNQAYQRIESIRPDCSTIHSHSCVSDDYGNTSSGSINVELCYPDCKPCPVLSTFLFANVVTVPNAIDPNASLITGSRRNKVLLHDIMFAVCLLVGVYIASCPDKGDASTPGYPAGILSSRTRLWHTIGAMIMVGSTCHQPQTQKFLESCLLQYLGKVSFSFYVVHVPLLQIFGWSIATSVHHATVSENWALHGIGTIASWIVVSIPLIWITDLFWKFVEMPCAKVANSIDHWCFIKSQRMCHRSENQYQLKVVQFPGVDAGRFFQDGHTNNIAAEITTENSDFLTGSRCSSSHQYRQISALFLIGLVLLVGLVSKAFTYYSAPQDIYEGSYIRYPVPINHIGPRFQEKLSPSNTTTWLPSHLQLSDFYFRLDDQSLIPLNATTDSEREVRKWFATHYPQLEDVVRMGLHLNTTYLGPPDSQRRFRVDDRFHITHCVVSMRRFWRALDTGTHVAPRDMDMGHLNHCLTSLEDFTMNDYLWCKDSRLGPQWETRLGLQWETTVVW
jgi:peptidoglycan/LPS O-acetylase OafA/YrhL